MPSSSGIDQLVARFRIRARATREDYLDGRALAESNAVTIIEFGGASAHVLVQGEPSHHVTLQINGRELVADCDCDRNTSAVCAHMVAAEHSLWLHVRRAL